MPEPPTMSKADVLAELAAHFAALGPDWEDEEGVSQWPHWQRLLAAVAGWCVGRHDWTCNRCCRCHAAPERRADGTEDGR